MTSDDKYFDTEEYFSTPVQYDLQQAIHSMCDCGLGLSVYHTCKIPVTLLLLLVLARFISHPDSTTPPCVATGLLVRLGAPLCGMVRIYSQSIIQSVCCCSSSSLTIFKYRKEFLRKVIKRLWFQLVIPRGFQNYKICCVQKYIPCIVFQNYMHFAQYFCKTLKKLLYPNMVQNMKSTQAVFI